MERTNKLRESGLLELNYLISLLVLVVVIALYIASVFEPLYLIILYILLIYYLFIQGTVCF